MNNTTKTMTNCILGISFLLIIPLTMAYSETSTPFLKTDYVWLSPTSFIVFQTNDGGFELLDGGVFEDEKWNIFNTESKAFSMSENHNIITFPGSFKDTGNQFILIIPINDMKGDMSLWMQNHNGDTIKHTSSGKIYSLLN